MSRKQMRQIPNFLMNARGRPQSGQRLYALTPNLGLRCALMRSAVLAKSTSLMRFYLRKGIPINVSNSRPSSSFLADVTMVMFIPLILSILS